MTSNLAHFPDPDDDDIPPDLTLTAEQAAELVAALHAALRAGGCDHTLCAAESWAARMRVPWPRLRAELQGNGGYCDCEILFNVFPGDEWEES